jgi:hypothetical protein
MRCSTADNSMNGCSNRYTKSVALHTGSKRKVA